MKLRQSEFIRENVKVITISIIATALYNAANGINSAFILIIWDRLKFSPKCEQP